MAMLEGPVREPAHRLGRPHEDEDPDAADSSQRSRPGPSKLTRSAEDDRFSGASGSGQWRTAAPGKLTRADGAQVMSPAQSLEYSRWMLADQRGWSTVHRRAEPGGADPDAGALASAFEFLAATGAAQQLPSELARRLGEELGLDAARIRIHTDDRAAAAAARLGARAFTIGDDIYFAAGAYDPASEAGVELIAHEAAHVAQNQRGSAGSAGPAVSRPGDAHEREADDLARQFIARKSGRPVSDDPAELVESVRRHGQRVAIPGRAGLEQELGTDLGFVEAYTGEAAQLACQLMAAGAFAVRNIVAFADPSPQRETLVHELTHIVQMGGQAAAAPSKFRSGTLRISRHHDEAEVEAREVAGAGGAAPASSRISAKADPDVVHRDDKTPATTTPAADKWDPAAAKARGKTFLDALERADPAKPVFGPSNDDEYRFSDTSAKYFQRGDYTAKAFAGVTGLSKTAMDDELAHLWRDHAKELGLCKVGDGSLFAWVSPTDAKWTNKVEYLRDRTGKKADVTDKWKDYLTILERPSIKKHGIKPAPVDFKKSARCAFDKTVDFTEDGAKPFTEGELEKCRHSLIDAFVACADFHWNGGGKQHWECFFADVIKPEGGAVFMGAYSQIQGTIFGKIATEDIKKALGGGGGINRAEHFFADDGFLKNPTKTLAADAITVIGDKIRHPGVIDFKSGAETPDKGMLNAAHDYNLIVTKPVPSYKVDGVEQKQNFKHVMYVFATKEVAQSWASKLKTMIPGTDVLMIVPDPGVDGIGTVDMTMNPTFQIPLKDKTATTHKLSNPPIVHPGVSFKDVTVNTKAAGSTELVSGSATFDVAMGDALKGDNITKTLTPDGGNKAKVENKLPGLSGEISKLLKGAEVDAKVTDEGVEGTITVKSGTKLGVLAITGGSATVKYSKSGELSVSGELGLSYQDGKVKGKLAIGWAAGSWTFTGTVDFPAGMVEGLSAFTGTLSYGAGEWRLGINQLTYSRKMKAITVTGTVLGVKFDINKGELTGTVQLEADLGLFGRATARAELQQNKLTNAEFTYDSPELKYPAKSAKPSFKGTVGGTLTYEDGKFSGAVRGAAGINVPALQKLAGDSGLGLALDGHIHPDGHFSGSIGTTTPLKLGKHFEIPSVACTIKDDGSVEGDFKLKVVDFKYLEKVEIGCKVDQNGISISEIATKVAFGTAKDKVHGSIDVAFSQAKGLAITGEMSVKIKEGMVATGKLTYNSKTQLIDAELKVDEITLLKHGPVTKSLFKFAKQVPLVNVYGIGMYLDIGFNLDFNYEFDLRLQPKVSLEGLSVETFEYKQIKADIELLGLLAARLVATPKIGLGLFALSPSLLRGAGGVEIPITGEALLKPKGKFTVLYAPDDGVSGDAKLGMALTFGIKGSVNPYAHVSLLDGVWEKKWAGEPLANFEIMPPKELFNYELDLGGDLRKQDPKIPDAPGAPKGHAGKQLPQEKPTTTTVGSASGDKNAEAPTSGPGGASGGMPDEPVKLGSMTDGLKNLPGYKAIDNIMNKAGAAWDKIKGFFGRVAKTFKSYFESLASAMEEIVDGFAKEGLGYLPKLVKKIVGATAWEVIEPLITAVATNADKMLELFETSPPTGLADFFPWALRLAAKAWGLAFDSIGSLVTALRTMVSRLGGVATKLVTKMVADGMIGVKRHPYWVWALGWSGPYRNHFFAATQYKIHLLGVSIDFYDEGNITDPGSVVGFGLFQALEQMGVPSNSGAFDENIGEHSKDRWA
jgi:Domain of unknown function (DUF4157)